MVDDPLTDICASVGDDVDENRGLQRYAMTPSEQAVADELDERQHDHRADAVAVEHVRSERELQNAYLKCKRINTEKMTKAERYGATWTNGAK